MEGARRVSSCWSRSSSETSGTAASFGRFRRDRGAALGTQEDGHPVVLLLRSAPSHPRFAVRSRCARRRHGNRACLVDGGVPGGEVVHGVSFCSAAARLPSIAATSPGQPRSLASWSRSVRFAWISSKRGRPSRARPVSAPRLNFKLNPGPWDVLALAGGSGQQSAGKGPRPRAYRRGVKAPGSPAGVPDGPSGLCATEAGGNLLDGQFALSVVEGGSRSRTGKHLRGI